MAADGADFDDKFVVLFEEADFTFYSKGHVDADFVVVGFTNEGEWRCVARYGGGIFVGGVEPFCHAAETIVTEYFLCEEWHLLGGDWIEVTNDLSQGTAL